MNPPWEWFWFGLAVLGVLVVVGIILAATFDAGIGENKCEKCGHVNGDKTQK